MTTIRPFKGVRPKPEYAARVASRPYDVLTSEEARIQAAGNPCSFLHVTKPEIDLPAAVNPHDEAVYRKGRENLQRLLGDGILAQESKRCFYIYSQTMASHSQYGIVGCASVQEYLNNTVKKHELTRQEKEDDRTAHILATNAQTGPVFLTYRAEHNVDLLVNRIRSAKPALDFTADDGVRHQLWVVDEPFLIQSISSAFESIGSSYIADGHHRCAAAVRVAQKRAAGNPHHSGNEEYNSFLAVLVPHNQTRIMDYNRVVTDLHSHTPEEFLAHLKRTAEVSLEDMAVRPAAKGEVGMYLKGNWYRLRFNSDLLRSPDPVDKLDVSLLQSQILGPLLGIHDQRTDKRIDFVGGIRGLEELERRVNSGEMSVAFALYPTSIEELLAVADAGKIMPPKSTWFEPKLRDGIVVRLLT